MADGCAIGIRVKSGWASAVVVGLDRKTLTYLDRTRLLLSDPKAPKSAQPYHRGFGRLQKDAAALRRLTGIVLRATARSLTSFVAGCSAQGHAPQAVALVVGSTIDPQTIANEHIRAHAEESRLFRTALEQAARRLGLPCTVTRERDLGGLAREALGGGASHTVATLGASAGRPWRADEKLASLAAWLVLARGFAP